MSDLQLQNLSNSQATDSLTTEKTTLVVGGASTPYLEIPDYYENFFGGGEGPDTIEGGNRPDIAFGGPGPDKIKGGGGADVLIGD